MKRPLVPVALLFAGGVLAGEIWPEPWGWLFAATALCAAAACLQERRRGVWLAVGWALLGWTHHALEQAALSPWDLRRQMEPRPELVTLRGRLLRSPELRLVEDPAELQPAKPRSQAALRVVALRRGGEWVPATGDVLVTVPGRMGEGYYAGRQVEVFGVLEPPPGPTAPGLFDYRRYLAHEGVHFLLRTLSEADWRLTEVALPPPRPLADRFMDWASRTLARDLPGNPLPGRQDLVDEPFDLLRAMTLGWRTPLTDSVAEPFVRTGTMHVFAISGLHIALLAGILVNVLRAARVPRGACGLMVIPLIWLYTAATGWQPSALRASVMMSIVLAGWALARPLDLVNSLAAAALVLLWWRPGHLFQAGFQLSFAVVLSLGLLQPPFEKWGRRLLRTDPLQPVALRSRGRRWLEQAWRWAAPSLATSLAAWIGSLALVAQYFHVVSPVGLVVNLVVVPMGGLALMASLGALVCGGWLPWIGGLFNHSGWFWMKAMTEVTGWAATLPGAWFHVRAFTPLEWLLLYGGLGAGWAAARLTTSGRRAVGTVWLALALAWGWGQLRSEPATQITVLPAGSGGAVWIDAPGREEDVLVDTGSARVADVVVKPFLQSQGVNRMEHLVLTHGDLHHIGGLQILEGSFRCGRLWVSPVRFRSKAYRETLARWERNPGRVCQVERGETVAGWEVWHPAGGDRFAQADDGALVLARTVLGVRYVMVSDLGRLGQRGLADRLEEDRVGIVIAGIPAQSEPLSSPLLERWRPRVIVLQNGDYPATEAAKPALRERFRAAGAVVFTTQADGAVRLVAGASGCEVTSMRGRRAWVPALAGAVRGEESVIDGDQAFGSVPGRRKEHAVTVSERQIDPIDFHFTGIP